MQKRVLDLKDDPEQYERDSSIYELAEKEGEYRDKLIAKGKLSKEDINDLADGYSDETLEKLEEREGRLEAERDSLHDPLTGLLNRRSLEEIGTTAINRSRRNESPCSIMMLDIDYFKKVNDALGHQVGDEVIREVAKILKTGIRKSDESFRYGGEEFVAIMEGMDPKNAKDLAERVRAYIAENSTHKVTVSIGVYGTSGSWPAKNDKATLNIFIAGADKALYKSKESGRNKVTVFEEKRSEENNVPPESGALEADKFLKNHFD